MLALNMPGQYTKSHVLIVRAMDSKYAHRRTGFYDQAQPARTHAHASTRNSRTAHQHCHLPRWHRARQRCPSRPAPITARLPRCRRGDPVRLRTSCQCGPAQQLSPCQAAPSPSGPESTQAITPKSKWRIRAVRGRQAEAIRRGIAALLSSVPSLPTGASTVATPLAPFGPGSTGPTPDDSTEPRSSALAVRNFFTKTPRAR